MRGSDMTTDSKKNIVKLILFGIISLLLIIAASAMMNPTKWFDEKLIQDRNSRTVQMMEQPDNTIDILNLGDSLSTAGFSPMELWRDQGYTSFNIGADGMRMAEAYYAVVEACEKQQPKYLMIESLVLFRYAMGQDLQMLLLQPLYHQFAFLKYHNIWKSLVEDKGIMIYHRGYTVNQNEWGYDGEEEYMDLDMQDPNSKLTISALNGLQFDRIKKFCDERGIEIIIYSMPSAKNYNWTRVENAASFAQKNGVTYIDLNQKEEELGLDWELDTNDGGDHMNLSGARKVVAYLGNYLHSEGNLVDHRGDPAYSDWDEELVAYDELVEEMEGLSFQDIYNEKKQKEWDEKYRKKDTADHDNVTE